MSRPQPAFGVLAEFFDITKDSKSLFEGLAIMETPYAKEMNQYPVIFLSFSDCKGSYEFAKGYLFKRLLMEFDRYRTILNKLDKNTRLQENLQNTLEALIKGDNFEDISDAIRVLSEALYSIYNKKVMISIDEQAISRLRCDTPFIEAHVHGFYDKMHDILASLLRTSLKGNDSLQYAMLTGIQRVAKENLFSDLNNLVVCTVKDKHYASYFGFRPQPAFGAKEETKAFLELYGLSYNEEVKEMQALARLRCDGYKFFSTEMYNPWSIINYVDAQELRPFWINTSSNTMIKKAMENCELSFNKGFEFLIEHGYVETEVLMETSFLAIARLRCEQSQASSLWGLFINAGYLTIDETISPSDNWYRVRIPNREVRNEFKNITAHYLKIEDTQMTGMMMALKHKDISMFFQNYQEVLLQLPSYHDLKDENSYHLMMLGMCAWLSNEYTILSNREVGIGRADIVLKRKKDFLPNIIIEFKYAHRQSTQEDLVKLAKKGLLQIKDKQYMDSMTGDILCIGLTHQGKQVCIEYEEINNQ